MVDGRSLSSEEVIETLSAALIERYADDALAVAIRQAEQADDLPRETWDAIIARVSSAKAAGPDVASSNGDADRAAGSDG